jgi:hypothetical protein
MNINSRIAALQRKHVSLDQAVETAQKLPYANHLEVTKMKKEKLLLKEEIFRLSEA